MTQSIPSQIAERLGAALVVGGETFVAALAAVWSESPVLLVHEPPLPQDGPMDLAHMINERRTLDAAFHGLMADFRYENVFARALGDVVYLFCDQCGTLPDGVKVASPLCCRYTIAEGKIVGAVMAIDPPTIAPLQNAFEALAKAQKKAMTS